MEIQDSAQAATLGATLQPFSAMSDKELRLACYNAIPRNYQDGYARMQLARELAAWVLAEKP